MAEKSEETRCHEHDHVSEITPPSTPTPRGEQNPHRQPPPRSRRIHTLTKTGDGSVSKKNPEVNYINIICSNGIFFSVEVNIAETKVDTIKKVLAGKYGIPVNQQLLMYAGLVLEDDRTLESYGLQEDHTIFLIDQTYILELAPQKPPFVATETTPPSSSNPLPSAGGLALPGLDRPNGGMTDMLFSAISEIVQTLLSFPYILDEVIMQNRLLLHLFRCNPQLKTIMKNYKVVPQPTSPQMMEEIISLPKPLELMLKRSCYDLKTKQMPNVTSFLDERINITSLDELK